MIEVLALAGAVQQIAGAISSSIQAGRDVGSLLPKFGQLAGLEAEIQAAEQGKHKGPLGRLSSSEQEGFAIAQAKLAHAQALKELRSACMLYGPAGMWDLVVKEQTAARVRRQKAIEAESEARDKLFWRISLTLGIFGFLGGLSLMIWGLLSLLKLGANYEKITCLVLFVLFFSTALGLEDTHHVGSCNTVMREYVSYELRDAS
jgi:hypothetical protein